MKQWLLHLLIAGLAVLTPIHALLIATGVIIFIDLLTGVIRAIKSKEPISSSAMRRTVTKIMVYQLAIISAFIIETYMLNSIPMTKLVSSVIGLVEAKSILENLNEISGQNLFKALLKKLGSENDNI